MSALELDQFEALLEESDHDIYGWFQGAIPVPVAFDNDLMARLRRFDPSGVAPTSRT